MFRKPSERTPTSNSRAAERSGLLTLEQIAERRQRAASPRVYIHGYVPGGRSENITPPRRADSNRALVAATC